MDAGYEIKMLEEKIARLEDLLIEINSKIENFMGYEDITPEEEEKVKKIIEDMKNGNYVKFEEIFE